MAELPITHCKRQRPSGGRDGYRWLVGLEEDGDVKQLVVELSDSQAIETGLGTTGLDDALRVALQRYAKSRLRDGEPIFDQVAGWGSPVVLAADHFR